MTPLSSALFWRRFAMRTQTTDLLLVEDLEDLEDVGRTGSLRGKGVNDQADWVLHRAT
jgi:hypothetical protein